MASTAFASGDPLTRQEWSEALYEYAMDELWFVRRGFVGTTNNSIIQVNKDLQKKKGDKVTFQLRLPLRGEGQGDDGTLTGNEEALEFTSFQLEVHERAHATKAAGQMSAQRAGIEFRPQAKSALGSWLSEIQENDFVRALFGLYNPSGIETVNEKYPSSDRILYVGQDSAGNVGTAQTTDALLSAQTAADYLFGPEIVSLAKRKAERVSPKIRPIRINGREHYVMLVSQLQAKAFKATTAFKEAQQEAGRRGNENPIFSGALGIWDGVVLHEYDRVPERTGAGGTTPAEGFKLNAGKTATTDAVADTKTVARAVLLGAQAGAIGWAQSPRWLEGYADIGERHPQVGTDMLYGVSATRFKEYKASDGSTVENEDFGRICVDTQVIVD